MKINLNYIVKLKHVLKTKNIVFLQCRFIKHFIEQDLNLLCFFLLSERCNAIVEASNQERP